ncbi:hypothetical protein CGLAR1_06040 [Corynebacterium glutamicum]|uniref:hypothetical protein n=1 Tax=Corynebacterium glutamicum TaxID=1718 RepID=UPI0004F8122B|nr:hypothetical protein [Corynebacterium glutamicum]AIK84823.1 hypothetical protein CGLAR1_06040 [Corynebacterium glutamicum]AIK87607.1 hypothetical protein AR0_06175 [Corynebacterium glutamicum]
MSFFEDIAAGLDSDGIESRVNGDTMFVPITSDLEIQFVEIDSLLPAANVYIAAANVDEDDDEFEAVLVSVVFSVEDAVAAVAKHVATDQVVTVLRDLLEGTDERIQDLEFFQDAVNANLVRAEVGQNSELQVLVEVEDGVPTATVNFIAIGESFEDLIDQAIEELWESDGDAVLSDEDRQRMFADLTSELEFVTDEVLDLGTFTDFDRLFDILSLADDQAEDWEAQLVPFEDEEFDEPDVYDLFVDDSEEDDSEEDDDEDDDFDDDLDDDEDDEDDDED